MWGGHSCPPLLTLVVPDLRPQLKINGEIKFKFKIGGKECPPHIHGACQFLTETSHYLCMPIPLSLTGKVALITGGSRGIGAATVRLFVAAGARVLFNYEKSKAPAEQLVKELGQENCAAVACNLSGTETAHELVSAAVKRFGRLDILVANHGVWPPQDAPIEKMSDAQWHSTIAINLDSVFALIKHSVAQMKKQGKTGSAAGHIVLVSSTAGQRGEAFHCDYAATKGALISMVKGLSTELARDAIYVNSVAPGWVDTDMSASALSDAATSKRIFAAIPLGRVATPQEIAGPILFLCSEYSGFITGEVFNVNGGAVLIG
jgi:3-oxoacyl-[acyl-carrier protein] reductase